MKRTAIDSRIAIGYARVSTDKQDNSADAQRRKIQAQAELKGFGVIEVIEDIDEFSGDLDRPGVKRLLDLVNGRKLSAVIITKLDRLTRSTRDALDLIELFAKKGVALISIGDNLDTQSAMGMFVVTIIAAIGELERKMIGSRTKDGMQNLKAQGFPAGPAPYGWRSVGKKQQMQKVPEEQNIISYIQSLRGAGRSMAYIAVALNDCGWRTRRGTPWRFQYVASILKGEK